MYLAKIMSAKEGSFGLSPLPVTVANEGLGWDSLLKMVHNPGGDEPASWEGGQAKGSCINSLRFGKVRSPQPT